MALADYYDRSATAVSQVVAGFDATAFRSLLEGTNVGVSFGDDAASTPQGRAALDLTVRLLARLYPSLDIRTTPKASPASSRLAATLRRLAVGINPNITLARTAHTGITVGTTKSPFEQPVYCGCDARTGSVSLTNPQPVGRTDVVYGACVAAAAIFRLVVTPGSPPPADAMLNVFGNSTHVPTRSSLRRGLLLPQRSNLVGAGAGGKS